MFSRPWARCDRQLLGYYGLWWRGWRGLTGVRSRCSLPLWTEGILGHCRGNNSESADKHNICHSCTQNKTTCGWWTAVCSLTHHRVGSHRHSSAVGQVVEDVGRFWQQVAAEKQQVRAETLQTEYWCQTVSTYWFFSRSNRKRRPPTSRPHCSRSGWPSWKHTVLHLLPQSTLWQLRNHRYYHYQNQFY